MTEPQASSSPTVRFGQPSRGPNLTPGFGRAGAFAGVTVILVLLGGLLWSAAANHAASAQHPRLFGGSLVLEDQRALPVIDVATGQLTVRLTDVFSQVGAPSYSDVEAVPVDAGTMLIDRRSGTFNLLGRDNYVLDAAGPGVGLGPLAGLQGAGALAAGADAYIVRYAPHSTVTLVDEATVVAGARMEKAAMAAGTTSAAAAAAPGRAVTPRGFAALDGAVAGGPGSAAVSGSDLWTLVGAGLACQVQQLHPVTTGHNGLLPATRTTLPVVCTKAAVEAAAGTVGVATPGHVRLFAAGGPAAGQDVAVGGTATDSEFLPVTAAAGTLWYLAGGATGWSLFGVGPTGRVTGPVALDHFGRQAQPVVPVESGGVLYTLDQAAAGQPTLWSILPATGAMIPVAGAATYPVSNAAEKVSFQGAQALVDGPRVVFNNPGSHLAVVVFTDGSHAPVVVDKSTALQVSTAGPADLTATPPPPTHGKGSAAAAGRSAPAVQAVSQAVTCAKTTQKPYAPQITAVAPSSGAALITWSYQLLDQQDCEPDSWAVKVQALTGSHQPAQPVQVVNGQTQLQFTGLRPATTYQVVVTAWINAQSTPSTPATFTTAARGPDAPIAVHTTADANGNWVVSWTPCTAASCVVPADTWNVIGAACGSAFVGTPPSVQVGGAQTSVTIPAAGTGGLSADGLLGESLSFSVQGVLASGLTGDPTADHACTEAWRPPNPAAISLVASGAEDPTRSAITATLQVSTKGSSAVAALGSRSTEYVYSIDGKPVTAPTTATTVHVAGLAAGVQHTPAVSVYPAGHPTAAVAITGQPFSHTLSWPAVSMSVAPSIDANPNSGTLKLSFAGLPPGLLPNQIKVGGTLTCGSTSMPIGGGVTNGVLTPAPQYDVDIIGSGCGLSGMSLSDTAPVDPYGVSDSIPSYGPFDFGLATHLQLQRRLRLAAAVSTSWAAAMPWS